MTEFGHFSLVLAWLLALYGLVAGLVAGYRKDERWFRSVRASTILAGFSAFLAVVLLARAFLEDDYTLQYVWQHSNRDMDPVYKVTAVWGGMDGSMLLWCAMLALSSAILAYQSARLPITLMPFVLSMTNSASLFFLTIVMFLTNPFRYIQAGFIPPDGNGLNPLLQNPLMAIHPPMLYAGFTTFAIPYAFCIGALLAGNLSNEWLRLTRRWTLIAWGFLTAGIVLGGGWAYVELGWGGFWAWDPVENASFLPWLTGTAFLHSVMVQERKNMLRFWNVWLVVLTYGLTVFGTFLTRSGVVQSVHAFASTDIGWVFLLYLGLMFVLTALLTFVRRRELRSERRIESFLSREAAFLLNNLVLLSICFATLWGVMFPVLSEAVTGQKQTVSIPFFNAVNVPLFLALLVLMGIGPLIAWRKASFASIRRTFLMPFLMGLVVAAALVWAGVDDYWAATTYGICWFVALTILGELHRGARAQNASNPAAAVGKLIRKHRSRYGGYLVHVGVLFATIGITASMAHKLEREFTIKEGESTRIGRYEMKLEAVRSADFGNYEALQARVQLARAVDRELVAVLEPELRVYKRNDETTTEVALHTGLRDDFYLVVAGFDNATGRVSFKAFVNPLQIWLWIGTLVMLAGTILIILPERRAAEARSPSVQPVTRAREVSA